MSYKNRFTSACFHVVLCVSLLALAHVASFAEEPKIKVNELAAEAPLPAKFPPELHVVGNHLETKEGATVILQGVNVISLEFSARGEHINRVAEVAVDDWKSNIIRLPVKDDYWFGKGAGQKDGGAAYREIVDAAITIVANRGAYVLLDLHRFRAPTDEHLAFWKDAAAKYKNHPAVLFDIFNEPHGISWEIWRNGGFVEEKKKKADEDSFLTEEEKKKNLNGFQSPGMQKLVDAIRGTGAKNIIAAGGLDWAFDLSGVTKGFALDDKDGNGIMYSTHIYPWKRGWKEKVLAAAEKYPVIVGEVGCDIKKMSFIPAAAQEDPYTWAPDMLGFLQKYKLNWTAFSFHPKATPVILTDWSFTPTPFWGAFVKQALSGNAFEMKKMR